MPFFHFKCKLWENKRRGGRWLLQNSILSGPIIKSKSYSQYFTKVRGFPVKDEENKLEDFLESLYQYTRQSLFTHLLMWPPLKYILSVLFFQCVPLLLFYFQYIHHLCLITPLYMQRCIVKLWKLGSILSLSGEKAAGLPKVSLYSHQWGMGTVSEQRAFTLSK